MSTQTLSHLLTNDHFIELEHLLSTPNLFSALRVDQHEIRHSKFLAYLLDPNETHGLGTAFIANFLLWLSRGSGQEIFIHDLDLDMATVTPEWSRADKVEKHRLDILIEIPPRFANINETQNSYFNGLVVAIECKIKSTQGERQLERYTELLEIFKDKSPIPVFLTISGEDCGDANDWIPLAYTDLVLNALKTTLSSHGKIISEKIRYILDDYKETILELSDERREGIEVLCENLLSFKGIFENQKYFDYLFNKHRRVTQTLINHIRSKNKKRGEIKKAFEEFCNNNSSKITYTTSNSANLRFYPAARESYPLSVNKSLKTETDGGFVYRWVKDGFPLLFEFFLQDSEPSVKLRLNLVFGPLSDDFNEERKGLIEDLKKVDSLPDKWKLKVRNKITNTFTGVFVYTELVDIDDVDHFKNMIDVLFNAAKALADKIDPVLRNSFLAK